MSHDPYKEGLLKIVADYKNIFYKNGEGFLKCIGKFDSVRGCLVALYHVLVSRKLCEPIETLPEKEKRDLWQEAKRISVAQDKDRLIEVAKAVHAFGTYIQIKL